MCAVVLVGRVFLYSNRTSAVTGGTPAITVDQQNIDMGYIKLGQYRTIKIKVTNTGDGVLRFKETPYIEAFFAGLFQGSTREKTRDQVGVALGYATISSPLSL